ncbi:RxLR effector protein [Phytophthora megakarya]|uniref:RxLR effector protein n=1 Tax=Phytophthora megakarya TaxID=4795 RepID=A0A225VLK1_9STRA|nr:RxLR effector protein [Phytophthora megakarya]
MRVKYLFYQVFAAVLLASNTVTIVTAIENSGTSKEIENSQITDPANRLLRIHQRLNKVDGTDKEERGINDPLLDLTKDVNIWFKNTKLAQNLNVQANQKILSKLQKLIDHPDKVAQNLNAQADKEILSKLQELIGHPDKNKIFKKLNV